MLFLFLICRPLARIRHDDIRAVMCKEGNQNRHNIARAYLICAGTLGGIQFVILVLV